MVADQATAVGRAHHLYRLSYWQTVSTARASFLRRVRQELTTITLVAIIVSAAVVALQLWLGAWRRPRVVVFNSLPFGLLVSMTIGGTVTVLLIALGPIVQRLSPGLRWVLWLAIFVVGSVIGTFAAPAILNAARVLPRDQVLVMFRSNILGTIPTTIIVGTFIMTVEVWRARVHAAEAQLASLSARVRVPVITANE
jgi:hypothetical protein